MPDSSARIWAILGGLLLLTLMMVALRTGMGEHYPALRARLLEIMAEATGGAGPVDIRNPYLLITARK